MGGAWRPYGKYFVDNITPYISFNSYNEILPVSHEERTAIHPENNISDISTLGQFYFKTKKDKERNHCK